MLRCKHLCCRDGLDAPPKQSRTSTVKTGQLKAYSSKQTSNGIKQQSLKSMISKPSQASSRSQSTSKQSSANIKLVDLTDRDCHVYQRSMREMRATEKLSTTYVKPTYPPLEEISPSARGESAFLENDKKESSDFDDDWMDDFLSSGVLRELDISTKSLSRQPIKEPPGSNKAPLIPHTTQRPLSPTLQHAISTETLDDTSLQDSQSSYFEQATTFNDGDLPQVEENIEAMFYCNENDSNFMTRSQQTPNANSLKRPGLYTETLRPEKKQKLQGSNMKASHIEPAQDQAGSVNQAPKLRNPRPFKNMDGIDLDLLAEFEDFVEFVDDPE